jgi:trk system potassium uptake protein
VRGKQVIIAHHNTVVQAEDHVIMFLVDKRYIADVERLFQVGITFI